MSHLKDFLPVWVRELISDLESCPHCYCDSCFHENSSEGLFLHFLLILNPNVLFCSDLWTQLQESCVRGGWCSPSGSLWSLSSPWGVNMKGSGLLLQYELLSLLTGAHFLLFLFNLWRFLFLWVQTGAPLLETELLVSENLLLLTDMLLWELWRNKEAQDRGYNWDVKIKTV